MRISRCTALAGLQWIAIGRPTISPSLSSALKANGARTGVTAIFTMNTPPPLAHGGNGARHGPLSPTPLRGPMGLRSGSPSGPRSACPRSPRISDEASASTRCSSSAAAVNSFDAASPLSPKRRMA
jgi:hypothetical protein